MEWDWEGKEAIADGEGLWGCTERWRNRAGRDRDRKTGKAKRDRGKEHSRSIIGGGRNRGRERQRDKERWKDRSKDRQTWEVRDRKTQRQGEKRETEGHNKTHDTKVDTKAGR